MVTENLRDCQRFLVIVFRIQHPALYDFSELWFIKEQDPKSQRFLVKSISCFLNHIAAEFSFGSIPFGFGPPLANPQCQHRNSMLQ